MNEKTHWENKCIGLENEIAEKDARIAVLQEAFDTMQILKEGVTEALILEEARAEAAEGKLCAAREELSNIASAKRFDNGDSNDGKSFADWAQRRARHTISSPAPCPHEAEAKRRMDTITNLIRSLTTVSDMLKGVSAPIVGKALIVIREAICFPEGRRAGRE